MGEYFEFLSRLADHEMLQFLGLPFMVFFAHIDPTACSRREQSDVCVDGRGKGTPGGSVEGWLLFHPNLQELKV